MVQRSWLTAGARAGAGVACHSGMRSKCSVKGWVDIEQQQAGSWLLACGQVTSRPCAPLCVCCRPTAGQVVQRLEALLPTL